MRRVTDDDRRSDHEIARAPCGIESAGDAEAQQRPGTVGEQPFRLIVGARGIAARAGKRDSTRQQRRLGAHASDDGDLGRGTRR
jgi:hypothetical protein